MSESKIKENYIYNGLGFPIILEKAKFYKVKGKWLLKIDVKKLSDIVIKLLPLKPSGLTGAEIRFARTYFEFSKRKLAENLNVSHTAVNKWEATNEEKANIDALSEVALRAFFKLQLNEDRGFSKFYREVMNEAKGFKELNTNPIRVAI